MNETLAANSNIALYFAMAVFTIAMVSYAVDLAGFAPRVAEPAEPEEARELVAAGRPGAAGAAGAVDGRPVDGTPAGGPSATGDGAAARRRPAAGIAIALTWLGTLVLASSVRDARPVRDAAAVGQHVRVRHHRLARGRAWRSASSACGVTCAGWGCSWSGRCC